MATFCIILLLNTWKYLTWYGTTLMNDANTFASHWCRDSVQEMVLITSTCTITLCSFIFWWFTIRISRSADKVLWRGVVTQLKGHTSALIVLKCNPHTTFILHAQRACESSCRYNTAHQTTRQYTLFVQATPQRAAAQTALRRQCQFSTCRQNAFQQTLLIYVCQLLLLFISVLLWLF